MLHFSFNSAAGYNYACNAFCINMLVGLLNTYLNIHITYYTAQLQREIVYCAHVKIPFTFNVYIKLTAF